MQFYGSSGGYLYRTSHKFDPPPLKLVNFRQKNLKRLSFFVINIIFKFQRKMGKFIFPFCLSVIAIILFARDCNAQSKDGNSSEALLTEREKKGKIINLSQLVCRQNLYCSQILVFYELHNYVLFCFAYLQLPMVENH